MVESNLTQNLSLFADCNEKFVSGRGMRWDVSAVGRTFPGSATDKRKIFTLLFKKMGDSALTPAMFRLFNSDSRDSQRDSTLLAASPCELCQIDVTHYGAMLQMCRRHEVKF